MGNINLTTEELATLYNMILVERVIRRETPEHMTRVLESMRLKTLKAMNIDVPFKAKEDNP